MDIPKVRLGRTELYVTKTSFGALPVQRIGHEAARKLLRRAYDFGPPSHLLSCGGAVLNVSDGTLDAHGQRVELTRNECRILQLLLEHKGEIVSRDALMTRLWESDSFVDENTLTVNIARLRRKLEAAGLPDFIRTRKGAGYLVEG